MPYLNLSFSLSLLFMGFLLANIFGIIINRHNEVILFVLGIELINYLVYSRKTGSSFSLPLFVNGNSINKLRERKLTNFLRTLFYSSLVAPNRKQKRPRDSFVGLVQGKTGIEAIKKYKSSRIISTIVVFATSSLNFLKIGFLFGFFIDAFKLGS